MSKYLGRDTVFKEMNSDFMAPKQHIKKRNLNLVQYSSGIKLSINDSKPFELVHPQKQIQDIETKRNLQILEQPQSNQVKKRGNGAFFQENTTESVNYYRTLKKKTFHDETNFKSYESISNLRQSFSPQKKQFVKQNNHLNSENMKSSIEVGNRQIPKEIKNPKECFQSQQQVVNPNQTFFSRPFKYQYANYKGHGFYME